jgi:hypothetical protein
LSPSTSLGRSEATLGSTATRTTGLTLNFMACRCKHVETVFASQYKLESTWQQ